VPVGRRLARKGLSPAAAVTFMLAAPIVNPVVIASTFVAYRGRDSQWLMVGGPVRLGMIVAMCVGWVIGSRAPGRAARGGATVTDETDDHDEPRGRPVHHAPVGRPRVHGALPDRRRPDRRDDPDVRAGVAREPTGVAAGA
jgi:hypothetical protein